MTSIFSFLILAISSAKLQKLAWLGMFSAIARARFLRRVSTSDSAGCFLVGMFLFRHVCREN